MIFFAASREREGVLLLEGSAILNCFKKSQAWRRESLPNVLAQCTRPFPCGMVAPAEPGTGKIKTCQPQYLMPWCALPPRKSLRVQVMSVRASERVSVPKKDMKTPTLQFKDEHIIN